MTTLQKVAAFVLFLGAAVYLVLVELHRPDIIPATDVYSYFLPNMVHAARSVWHGGKGLLWNPFQSCGEPFFASGVTGLLYPPHLLFLALDANTAVHAVLIVNLMLGAAGMFLLVRELGLSRIAALGGALAFEIGDPMVQFTGWSPMTNGPWAWLPWALLFCERLLHVPSRGGIVGLATVLALQLLPGVVLIAVFTYQLIALRVAWEIVTRRAGRPWRSAVAIVAGMALAPLLVAIQLLPAVELAQASIRIAGSAGDILTPHLFAPAQILGTTARRRPPAPFLVVPILLGVVALFASARRRLAMFFTLTGVLYGLLALGEATPLLGLYLRLPPGAAVLRVPVRLFWITGLCLTVLAALGLEALATRREQPFRWWLRPLFVAFLAVTLYRFAPGGLRWSEGAALAGVAIAVLLVNARSALARSAVWLALAALALNLVMVPLRWRGGLLPSAADLWKHEDVFTALGPPITAQDRVFLMPDVASAFRIDFAARTATVLRLPNFSDYETLPGRRFAEYLTMLRKGEPFSGMMDAYWPFPWLTPNVRRRLLDLASVRYLVASPSVEVDKVLDVPPVPLSASDLRVYRNDTALPRARYVPRIEVVPDPSTLLNRLAYGSDDLAMVAFVEEPMPSGFTGIAGARGAGASTFVTNDPEHLVLEVDAPQRGFVVLADKYYEGWQATVNGAAVPIVRANYAFRLVEVPAGRSRVEFRFRPASVALGAAISAVTIVGLGVLLVRGRRRAATRRKRSLLWKRRGQGGFAAGDAGATNPP